MIVLQKKCFVFLLFVDLQLAAELGKTLLERNKELEQVLKHHQNVIDDQTQEIEVCFRSFRCFCDSEPLKIVLP